MIFYCRFHDDSLVSIPRVGFTIHFHRATPFISCEGLSDPGASDRARATFVMSRPIPFLPVSKSPSDGYQRNLTSLPSFFSRCTTPTEVCPSFLCPVYLYCSGLAVDIRLRLPFAKRVTAREHYSALRDPSTCAWQRAYISIVQLQTVLQCLCRMSSNEDRVA